MAVHDYKLRLYFHTNVCNANKSDRLNPVIEFDSGLGSKIKFRRSGEKYEDISFVHEKTNGVNDFYELIDFDGNFLPKLYKIADIFYQNFDTKTSVEDGKIWSFSGTITEIKKADKYFVFPIACNYGSVNRIITSGRNVSIEAINISGSSHTCMVNAVIIAITSPS